MCIRTHCQQGCIIPVAGDPAAKSPAILGLPLQIALHGTRGQIRGFLSASQLESPCDSFSLNCFFEGNILEANLLESFT